MNRRMVIVIGSISIVAVGLLLFYFFSCDTACNADRLREEGRPFTHISVDMFREQLPGGQIIDVRTPEEYVTGHLENAMLLDYHADDFKTRLGRLDRNQPYYVYCESGYRSKKTLEIMKIAGFEDVYGLDGGMVAWRKAGSENE